VKPYYEHAGITIYHGDCLPVIETLAPHYGDKPFDLLLTDPPYGINADRDRKTPEHWWVDYGLSGWDDKPADTATLAAARRMCRKSVMWGGNYFDLPTTS
jgi:site-specific DNA-methyltransferase (adenine-specific)